MTESKDKRVHAEEVLSEVLKLMGVSARLEVKDVPATEAAGDKQAQPASISAAIFPEGDAPGLAPGKRSPVADALQFLTNKIVNRGQDKKWINLGVGGHPEPRQQRPQQQPQQPAPAQPGQPSGGAAAAPSGEKAPAQGAQPQRPKREKKQRGGRGEGDGTVKQQVQAERERERPRSVDEAHLQASEDPALQRLGRALAEKAAQFGRYYAVLPMTPEERVNLQKGAAGVTDVTVKLEGEGRHRRVVFIPVNPKPMPKKSAMPDYDDEEDVDEE